MIDINGYVGWMIFQECHKQQNTLDLYFEELNRFAISFTDKIAKNTSNDAINNNK